MAFGTMFGQDMDRIIHDLISFGYIGPDQGDKSDIIVSDMFMVTDNLPSWIELVDLKFFEEDQAPVYATLTLAKETGENPVDFERHDTP